MRFFLPLSNLHNKYYTTRRILPAIAIIGLSANTIVDLFNISNVRYVAFIVCISTLILFGLALWELLSLRIRLQQEDEKEMVYIPLNETYCTKYITNEVFSCVSQLLHLLLILKSFMIQVISRK